MITRSMVFRFGVVLLILDPNTDARKRFKNQLRTQMKSNDWVIMNQMLILQPILLIYHLLLKVGFRLGMLINKRYKSYTLCRRNNPTITLQKFKYWCEETRIAWRIKFKFVLGLPYIGQDDAPRNFNGRYGLVKYKN